MIRRLLTVAMLLCAPPGMAGQPGSSLAEAASVLLPKYLAATDDAGLRTLAALQLAVGDLDAAAAATDRLAELRGRSSPTARYSVAWNGMYIRAKRLEVAGLDPEAALARAFAELYGTQSDQEAAEQLSRFGADLTALQQGLARAQAACASVALQDCTTAVDVFAYQMVLDIWMRLEGVRPLIAADARRRFIVEDQLLIPGGEGAQISTLVIRPRTSARVTALMEFTIYANRDWSIGDAFKMAAHGYAGVAAWSRGKGRSPGPILPYVNDGKDAAAVIEWLADQPWSDGRVGMFSGSYNAFTQWAAAKHRPPALKALATNASNAPGIDTPMQGNVFQTFIYAWPFYTTNNKTLDDATYNDQARWDRMTREWYLSGRPYRELPLIDGQPNPVFSEWLRHPAYDAYWRALVPVGREFASIDIPVFVQTGYFDGGMVGALHYFQQHLRHRPHADHRMLIGPYGHTDMQTGVAPFMRGLVVDRSAMLDLQDVRLKWFDHVFRGMQLPEILRGRVNFQVMGADQWRHVDTVEQMATARRRLYLSGGEAGQGLMLTPLPQSLPPPLRIDFADRSDIDFRPPAGELDARGALVFETAPFAEPMEIAGLFKGHFEVEINKRDFDLTVYLFEKGPDGRYLRLASYLGRASHMKDASRRNLLRPGRRFALDFESQTVAGRRMPAGSRLVALVGVPKNPGAQINYGTGRDVSDESIKDAGEPLEIRWSGSSFLEIGTRE